MSGYLKFILTFIGSLMCIRRSSDNVGSNFSDTVILSHNTGGASTLPVDTVMNFIQKPPVVSPALDNLLFIQEPEWEPSGRLVLSGGDYDIDTPTAHDEIIPSTKNQTEMEQLHQYRAPSENSTSPCSECDSVNSDVILTAPCHELFTSPENGTVVTTMEPAAAHQDDHEPVELNVTIPAAAQIEEPANNTEKENTTVVPSPTVEPAAAHRDEPTNHTVIDTGATLESPKSMGKENATAKADPSVEFKSFNQFPREPLEFINQVIATPSSTSAATGEWQRQSQVIPANRFFTIQDDVATEFEKFVEKRYTVPIVWANIRSITNPFPPELSNINGFAEPKTRDAGANPQDKSSDAATTSTAIAINKCRKEKTKRNRLRAIANKDTKDADETLDLSSLEEDDEDSALACQYSDDTVESMTDDDLKATAEESILWQCTLMALERDTVPWWERPRYSLPLDLKHCDLYSCKGSRQYKRNGRYHDIQVTPEDCAHVEKVLTASNIHWLPAIMTLALRGPKPAKVRQEEIPEIHDMSGCNIMSAYTIVLIAMAFTIV